MAYIIAAAGGHGDYINNEVNAAFLGRDPHWAEVRQSSAQVDMRNAVAYEDGRRGAVHTYRNTQHIDRLDRTFIFSTGGPNYDALPGGGRYKGKPLIMAFNHAARDWDAPDRWAHWPGASNAIFTNSLCCKHPITEAVYVLATQDGGTLRRFDPDDNSWSTVASGLQARYFGAIDPANNSLLCFGDYSGTLEPFLVNLGTGSIQVPPFGGLGSQALRVRGGAGVVHDEIENCFMVLGDSTANRLLRVRTSDFHVETVSPAGVAPSGRANGWQNAWQFVPRLKGIVCASSYGDDMLYLRTSA
jgi:hypothetical protein